MSSWHTSQLKYAFGVSTLFSFYGVVSYIVWMFGDKYGYDMTYRITVIALILLTLPISLMMGYVATRRQKKAEKKKEEEAKAAAEKPDEAQGQTAAAPTGKYDDLTKSVEETVQFLKNSNLGTTGKDAVYSLPWYLVMGTPKSGKSSLVLGSELSFQILPSQRQSEQKFLKPTRSVDWRVTNDAVFLDTAGRFQTEGVDEDEWSALIETIKKYRGNRPLDGLLLTVSAERILQSDEREVEELAKILRARLDDARQRLKVKFPVYLIFTHADAIEGFRDSFSNSKQEGKNLVWGSTFPLEKTDNSQALFDGEYELLHNSVMKRRLMRLSAPFPPVRQLRIFNFPLHFGAARRKLGTFVTTLFRPNPFSESPFLRGFYFTAVPVNRPKFDGSKTMSNIPQTIGQTYFTEKFFRDVLLRDKDLVKTFQQQQQKPPIWGWILTAAGAFVVFVLLALSGLSLYNNKLLLDDASSKGSEVVKIYKADAGTNPLEKDQAKTREEIKALDNLRDTLIKLDDYERDGAPWSYRFGLYSGDKIYREALLNIYFNAVEQRFTEPVVRKLEDDLKKFSASQLSGNAEQQDAVVDKNYDLLTAYLMLTSDKDKAESSVLVKSLKDYWVTESKLPADLSDTALEHLKFYAKQVNRPQFPPQNLNGELVSAVRQKLKMYPLVKQYYKQKISEISKKLEDQNGSITAERILATGGGTNFIEGTYTVPNAYTLEGNQLMKTAIDEANQKLNDVVWVIGEQNNRNVDPATDKKTLENMYYNDYAIEWKKFVGGLNVKPYNKETADEALIAFSDPNSPIDHILKEVARQTNLSAAPKSEGWFDWIISGIQSLFQRTKKTDASVSTPVETEFRPLYEFLGEEGKADTPISNYRNTIKTVEKKYSEIAGSVDQISQDLENGNKSAFPQLTQAENNIKGLLNPINKTPTGQDIAAFLQQPIGNLQILLGSDLKTQIEKSWAQKLLPAAKNIEKGYPFDASDTEADLKNIRAFLSPKGELSNFFNQSLKTYFETVDGKLKVKENSKVAFSDEFVNYLNNAFRLRKALYGDSGTTEKFEYEFKLNPLKDGSVVEITIDGQSLKSEDTGSAKLTFPASSGQTGVQMTLGTIGGTVTTTPSSTPTANSSANTQTTNVNSSRNFLQNNSDSTSNTKKWQGTWGFFRFFDEGSPQKQPTGEYILTHRLGGKIVTSTVKPSGEDLFDKNVFKAVHAPDKILK